MFERELYGPIFAFFGRLFHRLQCLSKAVPLPGTGTRESPEKQAAKLVRVDRYLMVVYSIELSLVFGVAASGSNVHPIAAVVIAGFALVRIADIVQAAVNATLFDPIRLAHMGPQTILTFHRKLLLESINFVELIVLFGCLYALSPSHLKNADDWSDAFYFSAITQLTIGYGDVHPLGIFKLMAAIQGLTGFFFALVVLARIVSVLPAMTDLSKLRAELERRGDQG